ncbi:MAG: tRNA (adenosine(37)-N6)-threonylcarbamoyltransferase complex ATPase subunit type 1 TsaE [Phycisphaerae bacterium]|nr:tRNA (adenosine(37)-N6)-threonylcarbamoyltransferase complex ATPase subunit type 1 TsaE [Phycisphaerae bacterium]
MIDSTWERISTSERDTRRIGECVAAGVAASARRAAIVTLEGELGAGKTRLVRGLAAGLGIEPDAVTSPTFVISVEHRGTGGADSIDLVHIDAWRVHSDEELESIGWDDVLRRERCLVAVEWPSRIAAALPAERIDITLEHEIDGHRRVTIVDRRDDPGDRRKLGDALAFYTAAPPSAARAATCPSCGKPVATDAATFPFCSSRCRMADLGRWFGGRYTVSRPIESDEELTD